MAAPDPYAGTVEEFKVLHWQETVASRSPNGAAMFSRGTGEAPLAGIIDSIKTRGALRFALGYATVAGSPQVLRRTPPVFHPKFPGMICTSAAVEDFKPLPLSNVGGGVTLKRAARAAVNAATSLQNHANYQKAKFTLRFEPLAFDILSDVATIFEWERWSWIDEEPKVEALSVTGDQLTFAEGAGTPLLTYSSPFGKPYPAELSQILIQSNLVVYWQDVPENWIMTIGTTSPGRLIAGMGRVNSLTWRGRPAGTLRLDGVKLQRKPWALAAGTEARWSYDVQLLMSWFDPPKGRTGTPAMPITDNKGWNNGPWRGRTGPGAIFTIGDLNAGKWFLMTYDGSPTGQRLYGETNFDRLFGCPQNP